MFVCPSVRPSVRQSPPGLKSTLSGLEPALSGLESEKIGFRPEMADFRPERAESRPERADFRPKRADFRPKGGTNKRMDRRTDEQTKVPLCSTGLRPLQDRCPKIENCLIPQTGYTAAPVA